MNKHPIQTKSELDEWHQVNDPWGYESTPDDQVRKSILLSELPKRSFRRVLDIGCGQGFITRDLPGEEIIGIDISSQAVHHAQQYANQRTRFLQGSIFELDRLVEKNFDLIVVTGVLYPQYVGHALGLIYRQIGNHLAEGGILASVHIDAWYEARFPLLRFKEHFYQYREYTHRLELYIK